MTSPPEPAAAALSHIDADGRVRQVDVTGKPATDRMAEARGFLRVSAVALTAMAERRLHKGDPVEVARVAAIQAAKRTADLIPLCHQIPLSQVEVEIKVEADGIDVRAVARAHWSTGVEMEALTAVMGALLCLYDMLKAVDKTMVLEAVRVTRKTGGRSGDIAVD